MYIGSLRLNTATNTNKSENTAAAAAVTSDKTRTRFDDRGTEYRRLGESVPTVAMTENSAELIMPEDVLSVAVKVRDVAAQHPCDVN